MVQRTERRNEWLAVATRSPMTAWGVHVGAMLWEGPRGGVRNVQRTMGADPH